MTQRNGYFPFWRRPAHYFNVLWPCGFIYACEQAALVSQTLNGALALIAANRCPQPVSPDAAAQSYDRPAQEIQMH